MEKISIMHDEKFIKKIKTRSFSIDLTVAFALLIIFIIASIFTVVYSTSKRASIKLAKKQFNKNAERIIEKTDSFLKGIENAASVTTEVFQIENNHLDFDSIQAKILLRTLISYKDIALIYFGNSDGFFIQAGRVGNKLFQKKISPQEPNKAVYRFFDENMKISDSIKNTSYNPRIRPWYIGAVNNKKVFWSDPYVFFETGELGITVSIPVFSKNNNSKILGVIGADIPLTSLSDFLRTLDLTEHEFALISDNSNSVVAFSGSDKIINVNNDIKTRKQIKELNIPVIAKTLEYMPKNKKTSFVDFSFNKKQYLANITVFPEKFEKKWFITILAPADDFLKALQTLINNIFMIALPGVFLAFIITWILAKKISTPIEKLSEDVKHIQNFNLDFDPQINSHISEIQTMNVAIQAMKHSLKAFKLYVPQDLVKSLILEGKGHISIGGNEEYLTLFFSDIADFTSISENLSPQDLLLQLSEYFECIANVIEACHGTVDKFIGDAVMALWGAPQKDQLQEKAACKAALLCIEAIDKLNTKWIADGKDPFYTRIGVHSTKAIVGNIGSTKRMNYTVLGDGVNLASRLEGVNKIYNTNILISQTTFDKVKDEFICRKLDKITVKGKNNTVVIYELLSENPSSKAVYYQSFANEWETALDQYFQKNWKVAGDLFKEFQTKYPEDDTAQIFIARCRKYNQSAPNNNWSGISVLQNK